ncbi:MAG TPA: DUF4331 domain-containing protein [Chloroflexota bacterium]|nr:DUF4331 domain-containing protein [Chloroflexota bacterium]
MPQALRTIAHAALATAAVALLAIPPLSAPTSQAASHREAPLISMDPEADITDFFMFRSYESGKEDRIILAMDVIPGEEPSSGPNYWNLDPNVLYAINVDNDADGEANDVRFEFQFRTERVRGPIDQLGLFLSYLGAGGSPFPPITALDGPGSEGIGLRQRYSVTMVRDGQRHRLAENLIAVPSNVGPRTMPNYEALAAQGVYTVHHGGQDVRLFVGQRQDPFNIDLGGIFDTLNLRRNPPLLSPAEDADDTRNPFGTDMLSGFNVHTLAVEVPVSLLTRDGKGPSDTAQPKLGAYASTSRRRVSVLREPREQTQEEWNEELQDGRTARGRNSSGPWVQVQRLANPLVNEAIIGTEDKDLWNTLPPDQERRFLDYYLNPRLAAALQAVYGVNAATSDRNDLVNLLLKYDPSDRRLAELLRLDVSVAPTPFNAQKRLGPLATDASGNPAPDNAAWPNGRRPKDDVTDVAIRVVGGPNYIQARAGDGVNVDDAPLPDRFPFLASPADGRNRVHQNP